MALKGTAQTEKMWEKKKWADWIDECLTLFVPSKFQKERGWGCEGNRADVFAMLNCHKPNKVRWNVAIKEKATEDATTDPFYN